MKIEWVVLSHYNGSRCCNRCLYPHYNSLVMLVLLYDIILLLMKIKKLTRVKKNSFTWIQRFFYIIISPCAFLYYFYSIFLFWNCWPFSCYYNVHRNIEKLNHSKTKNILCEIMLLAPFFDLDFCSPIRQLRPLIPALRIDYYLQYLSRLSTKSPTRGSGGRNTLISMKFSTWPLSSFLYVCSLERYVEEVYNSVHNINFQYKMEAKLNNNYYLNVKR